MTITSRPESASEGLLSIPATIPGGGLRARGRQSPLALEHPPGIVAEGKRTLI